MHPSMHDRLDIPTEYVPYTACCVNDGMVEVSGSFTSTYLRRKRPCWSVKHLTGADALPPTCKYIR